MNVPSSPDPKADPAAHAAQDLAHDLQNLLNPLGLQIALLERRVADDARALEILSAMRTSLGDASREIGRLRQLGEPPS